MEKKNDIVEIHLLTNKATETCKLVINGEGADLISLIVAAMSEDKTFREIIEMSNRMYNIFNEQKPQILDHKN
jgi:L-2-hydroxyglutarate oxidase LhgO